MQNNLTFRAANEQIRAKAAEYDEPMERIPFLCECPDLSEAPLGEVMARADGYVVVEKDVS